VGNDKLWFGANDFFKEGEFHYTDGSIGNPMGGEYGEHIRDV
jgi:hypothetical protein